MKILHILKGEPEESIKRIIEEHKKDNAVQTIELKKDKNYDFIVRLIEDSDKVISW
jgi:hypothetical protein